MRKKIVVYQSKYGATETYAKWLSDELKCDIIEKSKCKADMLQNYDVIIYGAGIYATGIAGISFIKKNYKSLKDKRIITFAVGASPFAEEAMLEIKKKNLTDEIADIPCFYCRGTFDEEKMTMGDRMLIGMLKKAVGKKDPKDYETWEKALMESVGRPGDWTSKEYLKPIIDCALE